MPLRKAATCALFFNALVAPGCGEEDCSCFFAGAVNIQAPSGAIESVKTSGPACADADIYCFESSSHTYPAGCGQTSIFARRPGQCDIEIALVDGRTITRSMTLVREPPATCCGGNVVTEKPGESTMTIPEH